MAPQKPRKPRKLLILKSARPGRMGRLFESDAARLEGRARLIRAYLDSGFNLGETAKALGYSSTSGLHQFGRASGLSVSVLRQSPSSLKEMLRQIGEQLKTASAEKPPKPPTYGGMASRGYAQKIKKPTMEEAIAALRESGSIAGAAESFGYKSSKSFAGFVSKKLGASAVQLSKEASLPEPRGRKPPTTEQLAQKRVQFLSRLEAALEAARFNIGVAAEHMRMTRQGLYNRAKRYGIDVGEVVQRLKVSRGSPEALKAEVTALASKGAWHAVSKIMLSAVGEEWLLEQYNSHERQVRDFDARYPGGSWKDMPELIKERNRIAVIKEGFRSMLENLRHAKKQ